MILNLESCDICENFFKDLYLLVCVNMLQVIIRDTFIHTDGNIANNVINERAEITSLIAGL